MCACLAMVVCHCSARLSTFVLTAAMPRHFIIRRSRFINGAKRGTVLSVILNVRVALLARMMNHPGADNASAVLTVRASATSTLTFVSTTLKRKRHL